ncbi:Uncharacterised protein [Mycobacteroides abscessus]|nr:Uncharacterised protein [Mycobacteroides abscessus]
MRRRTLPLGRDFGFGPLKRHADATRLADTHRMRGLSGRSICGLTPHAPRRLRAVKSMRIWSTDDSWVAQPDPSRSTHSPVTGRAALSDAASCSIGSELAQCARQ